MTPRQWDQIADAFDRIAESGQRRPVSRLDDRADQALIRMRCPIARGRGGRSISYSMQFAAKRSRARAWAKHCRAMAARAAVRIDAARPHPTTVGPVANDRLPSDRELARYDRQRLGAERGRALRLVIGRGIG